MERAIELLVVALATFIASSGGFWMYLRARSEQRYKEANATTRLLMGIARDRILSLGFTYVNRGWLTHDEYQNLKKYLVEPYIDLGGNGTVRRLVRAIENLPLRPGPSYSFTDQDKRTAAAATIKMAEQVLEDLETTGEDP